MTEHKIGIQVYADLIEKPLSLEDQNTFKEYTAGLLTYTATCSCGWRFWSSRPNEAFAKLDGEAHLMQEGVFE